MVKFYCDRCLKEISGLERSKIRIERPAKELRFEYERYNIADYCPECMGKALDYLREWGNMRNEAGD